MEREQVLAVVPDLVIALESDAVQARLNAADNMQAIMQIVFEVYGEVFGRHGIDPMAGMQGLQVAAQTYKDDPEVAALLAEAQAKVQAARGG